MPGKAKTGKACGAAKAEAGRLAEVLEGLNPSQREAVEHEGGPLLIMAGAGSGKTRTLVCRAARLISKGAKPESILLLTFTRKAASEMLGRLKDLVGPAAAKVKGGTFHSHAAGVLRAECGVLGYRRDFEILDHADSLAFFGRVLNEAADAKVKAEGKEGGKVGGKAGASGQGGRFPNKARILQAISMSVNTELPITETIRKRFRDVLPFSGEIERLAEMYAEAKRKASVMDFDDLLVNFSKAMLDETVRERVAGRYAHLLVDEYQDTNPVQNRITFQLGKDHLNVTAVGDDAQSIYGFRGADVGLIRGFPRLFGTATVVRLHHNYRSTGGILKLANRVIEGGDSDYEKAMTAVRGAGPAPEAAEPWDVGDEAKLVGGRIAGLLEAGAAGGDIAVLFRNAGHSLDLEVALTAMRIPFTKRGGLKLLEKAHVRDFLAFLKVAHCPESVSLARLVGMLPGSGQKTAWAVADWVAADPARLSRLEEGPFRKPSRAAAARLGGLFAKICSSDDRMGKRPRQALDYYMPLMPELYDDNHREREKDLEAVASLAEAAGSLSAFLESLALDPPDHVIAAAGPSGAAGGRGAGVGKSPGKGAGVGKASGKGAGVGKASGKGAGVGKDGGGECVVLSTIHSAKGLEWPHVFILSAVEGRLPFYLSQNDDDLLEEERRLMYVAVTRAKDSLLVSSPRWVMAGDIEPERARPSRFLSAPPKRKAASGSSRARRAVSARKR